MINSTGPVLAFPVPGSPCDLAQNEVADSLADGIQGEPVDGLKFPPRRRTPRSAPLAVPALPLELLVNAVGKRRISLSRLADGRFELRLARPPIKELVLSGGGGKGRVYPALHEALEAQNALPGIDHVLGASAGAIFAALIASGMRGSAVRELTDSVDLLTLLDSKRSVKKSLQARLEALVPGRAKRFMRLLVRLKSKARGLREMLEQQTKAAVLERIEACCPPCSDRAVLEVRDRLRQSDKHLTFKDLAVVSAVVPGVKQLSVTGTAMFETGPQLVVFDQHTSPDTSVAEAVHASAAFPLLFKQVPVTYQGQLTPFQDGGLMCNTPVPDKYLKHPRAIGPSASEPLILTFQQSRPGNPAIETRTRSPLDWLSGTPNTAQGAYWAALLQPLKQRTVDMPTKTPFGDCSGLVDGTMNFDKLEEPTKFMRSRLYHSVQNHLRLHAQDRERFSYSSLDAALLALDDELFNDVHEAQPALAGEVKVFRDQVRGVLVKLSSAQLAGSERALAIVDELDGLLGQASGLRCDWVAEQLLQAGGVDAWPASQGMAAGVVGRALKMKQTAQMADNAREIARSLLAPSIFEDKQSASNKVLLGTRFARLMACSSREDIDQVLKDVIGQYRCKDPDASPLLQELKGWQASLAQ